MKEAVHEGLLGHLVAKSMVMKNARGKLGRELGTTQRLQWLPLRELGQTKLQGARPMQRIPLVYEHMLGRGRGAPTRGAPVHPTMHPDPKRGRRFLAPLLTAPRRQRSAKTSWVPGVREGKLEMQVGRPWKQGSLRCAGCCGAQTRKATRPAAMASRAGAATLAPAVTIPVGLEVDTEPLPLLP